MLGHNSLAAAARCLSAKKGDANDRHNLPARKDVAREARDEHDQFARDDFYRLDVGHDIRRGDLPIFYDLGGDLVDLIEDTGELTLLLSCWEASGEVVHIYNYWELTNGVDSLVAAELILPDDPAFIRFDKLMLAETKDIVVPFTPMSRPTRQKKTPDSKGYVYVRVEYQVPSKLLPEFRFRIDAGLLAFAEHNGWMLGDSYLGLTGTAGRVIQTWVVPKHSALLASQLLMTTQWQALLDARITCQILQATPSCPILGERPRARGYSTLPNRGTKVMNNLIAAANAPAEAI